MSRRTKLLISALFLVLLSVPAVYVALTWSTPNPLRFRIVGFEEPTSAGLFSTSGKLNMIVENTSSVPVHLFISVLQEANDPDTIADPFGPHWNVQVPDSIPPHTSLPCFCVTPGEVDPTPVLENIVVSYNWMSATRYRVREARQWLCYHVPAFVRPCMPTVWPSHEQGTTPLQPVPTTR